MSQEIDLDLMALDFRLYAGTFRGVVINLGDENLATDQAGQFAGSSSLSEIVEVFGSVWSVSGKRFAAQR